MRQPVGSGGGRRGGYYGRLDLARRDGDRRQRRGPPPPPGGDCRRPPPAGGRWGGRTGGGRERPARAEEVGQMQRRLAEALDAGAIGMSSGLYYAPAAHAPSSEIEALAQLLRPAGAIYTTHMRDEAEHVLDSLDETFHVGRSAQVPVVISHHKTTGMANFGRTAETLPKIAAAMMKQPIGLDAYPYIASSTVLRTDRLDEAQKVLITWSKTMPEQAGRELAEIAREWGVSIREAAQRLQPAGAIYWMMDEADVRRGLALANTRRGAAGRA